MVPHVPSTIEAASTVPMDLAGTVAVDGSSAPAISFPGGSPNILLTVVVSIALVLAIAVMIYLAFGLGSGPGRLGEIGDESDDGAESRDREAEDDDRRVEST